MKVKKLELHQGLVSQTGLPNVMRRPHYHDHVELNLLEHGAMTYLMGGQQFTIEAGRLLAFWAAIPHQVTEIAPGTTLHWLYIPLAFVLGWALSPRFLDALLSGLPIISAPQAQDLSQFQQWHSDLSAPQDDLYAIVLLEVEARLLRLARAYARSGPAVQPLRSNSSQNLKQARQMAEYIARRYTEPLTVKQIAGVVNLHPNYAMRVFHDQLQTSILDYLTRHRVAHAQRLLLTSDKQISEIGLEAGFGSASRFYAVFKRYSGQSPGQYRRRLQYRV